MCQLIDREQEMCIIDGIYGSDRSSLFILYGRRRTGKTRLLLESISGRNGLYFMAVESTIEQNISSLTKVMGQYLGDDYFSRIRFEGIEDLLTEFVSRAPEGVILIIDEFPYLFKYRPSILSEMQRVWDGRLKDSGIKLILCGSSISMMEQNVLSRSSPLYGRREGQWNLQPLPPGCIADFLPDYGLEDILKVYSVCDGIPEYLLKFVPEATFEWNLDHRVLSKGVYLSEEGRILLLHELNNIANYVRIMESISHGKGKQKEIAERTGMDKGMISKYVHNLMMIGYVDYLSPFGSTRKNRSGRYVMSDNYMDFYFRFIHPNSTELEAGILDFKLIRDDFRTYLGRIFEKMVRLMLLRSGSFKEVQPWWNRDDEIDVICKDERGQEILFGDIKWRNRKYSGNDLTIFTDRVHRFRSKDDLNRRMFVISRNGFRQNVMDEMDDQGILHFDLEELGPSIRRSRFDPRIDKDL